MSSQTHVYPKVDCCLSQRDTAIDDITEQLGVEEPKARYLVDALTRKVRTRLPRGANLPHALSRRSTAMRCNGSGPERVSLRTRVYKTVYQVTIPVAGQFVCGIFSTRKSVTDHLSDGLGIPLYIASRLVQDLLVSAPSGAPFCAYTETPKRGPLTMRVHFRVGQFHRDLTYEPESDVLDAQHVLDTSNDCAGVQRS